MTSVFPLEALILLVVIHMYPHFVYDMHVTHKITGQYKSGGDSDDTLNSLLNVEHHLSLWKVSKGLLNCFFVLHCGGNSV